MDLYNSTVIWFVPLRPQWKDWSVIVVYSLVAPVQSGCDVLLNIPHAVMGEVAHQYLPPEVQDFIHHVPKPVEQIPLVLLERENGKGEEARRWMERKLTTKEDVIRGRIKRGQTRTTRKPQGCKHDIRKKIPWSGKGRPSLSGRWRLQRRICANELQCPAVFSPQMYALWSVRIHQLRLISTPDSLMGRKIPSIIPMSVHQKAVNVGRRTDPPPPRKRHKKLNYSHHVELFPHGAPVSQRQRHLCDDRVLHRDDRLKLPAKVQTLRLESTPTQKHNTKILKKNKKENLAWLTLYS